jgi:hypothetical protein
VFQWKPAIRQFLTGGLAPSAWVTAKYADYPAMGRFEAEKFEPERWLPEYPNPAFSNMLPDDAFWAAKQVMAFTDEQIRAIVKTGEYSDPRVEETIVSTLIKRRDKIGRTFFAAVLPLDRFAVDEGRLTFNDLEIQHGFRKSRSYTFRWFNFDNQSGALSVIEGATSAIVPRTPAAFLACEITGDRPGRAVRIYLRANTTEIVGVTHDTELESAVRI